MRKWVPMLILASAQFVMVLDTSVMNVAISQIVDDLDTTIQGVQTAITLYTLVMAAFMLLGAKLGDILGRNRTFAIGLAIYGIGSLTTALSPNLAVLLVGWSGVEGFGAVLVVPSIAALTAANYEGSARALAYALLGGVAAVAIAAGPLVGGWVTTEFTWRYVFAGETVVVIVILLVRGQIARAPVSERRPQLDVVGVLLSAAGLGLMVLAILQSGKWGLIQPRGALTIGGTEITPLGFSVVPFMLLAGAGLLGAFVVWEEHRERQGRDRLLDTALLRIVQLRAGLSTLVGMQLVLMGTFFVIPVYLQVVLGLDAFETGKRLLPLSLTMLVAALAGPKLAARRSPRTVRPGRALRRQRGRVRDAGHARRHPQRHGVQDGHGADRRRRRPAGLPARQRDHVVGRPVEDQRGGRPAGYRAEPRLLAGHGAHRRRADRGPRDRLRRPDRRQPAAARGRARDDRRQHRGRHRHRPGRRGRADRAGEGAAGGPGAGRGGDLRRVPARGAPAVARRGRARRAAVAVVHPAAADRRTRAETASPTAEPAAAA